MKIDKRWLFFIFFACIISIFLCFEARAEFFTGRASIGPTNVSVYVLPPAPAITIISPINGTYLTNISLLLNFTSTPADNYWYNLDNGQNHTTSLPGGHFNSSEGIHTLYLYANKSGAIGRANVTFIVNLTLFKVLYEEYKGVFRGDSTDFYAYTYEQMLNMSDIVLENELYGKIYFKENISLPYDDNFYDYTLDLDNKTNISFNRIEVNATGLPNFDVTATIWFYGLGFIAPRVMRDGAVCYSCVIESYSGGILRVSIPGMGLYSVEEMPAAIMIGERGGYVEVPCTTTWICSNWSECKDGRQNRTCIKAIEWCEAEEPKPAEDVQCREKPPIAIEYPISKECCLIGICWFKFIICWYWWILIVISVLLWVIIRRIRRLLLARRIRKLKVRIVYRRTPVYSAENYMEFAARKSKSKEKLRKLDAEFKRGTIERRGYVLTRNKLLKEIEEMERKLRGE